MCVPRGHPHFPDDTNLKATIATLLGRKNFREIIRSKCSELIRLWINTVLRRSRWPRGLRRRSAAARLLGLRVRIPLGTWMSASCEFCVCVCVLSDRCLCDGPITRPEESYRVWSVTGWDRKTSTTRMPRTVRTVEPWKKKKKICHNNSWTYS